MNIRQIPTITAEAVLYTIAAILVVLCLGLTASIVGLPLVPLVVPAVVALVLLARRLGRGHHPPTAKV
ncbi:hypothetical protein ABZ848_29705 [Streptomyces sp. NPDC047081]|uniref:Uncharacterized protein n=1 Tax=Streptomyces cylindrosporus TaxID=2927583 RepID=A0ABS9YLU5_9ACTN|nr:hypothetical protein [Streptomyces cylindrosporus]MCI3278241.1 hypothetical protein [Streptomyces cylindrosporus]